MQFISPYMLGNVFQVYLQENTVAAAIHTAIFEMHGENTWNK